MPTYEYRCEACERTFEVVQSFKDDPLSTCEACGGHLRKVYAPVGIVFKGSGFYKTDSRQGSKSAVRTTSESSKPADASSDAPSSSSGSDKPAATPAGSKGDTAPAPSAPAPSASTTSSAPAAKPS